MKKPSAEKIGENTSRRLTLLESGGITQVIMRMSLPTIGSMLAIGVFYLADAAFISRLGTARLSAISVSFPIFAVIGGIGQAFGAGAASLVSRLLGKGEDEKASSAASAALFTAFFCGIAAASLSLLFLEPLLRLLGSSEAVLPFAMEYSRILIGANVLTLLNITMSNLVRAEGNARLSMISVFLSAGMNILLDPLFIFAAGLGLKGAALATVIAQFSSFLLLSSTFARKRNYSHISFSGWRRGIRYLPAILKVGAATFFLQLLGSVALAATNGAARRFGDHAVAAVGLTFRFLALGMYPIYGFCVGLQPVVGYSFGAENMPRVYRSLRLALGWTGLFALLFSACAVFFPAQILAIFSSDPDVLAVGIRMIRWVTAFFPLFGVQIVMAVFFQALGRALPAALIILARQVLFFYPAIFILPRLLGLDGVIYSQPVSDVLTAALTAILAIGVLRSLRKISNR
ncbi:MAG: MATE family efflux transporter [Spirochaetales bacterium]|nr:MATE family efflux transporter [Spirochaetales bacterium]